MKREQFTFYRSYFEALKTLPAKEFKAAVLAVCSYALDEETPSLSGVANSVFVLIRPTLDSGRKKAENRANKRGTKREQNENKTRTNAEQNRKEGEKEREGEGEVEREREGEEEREDDMSLSISQFPTPSLPCGSCGSNAGARAEAPLPPQHPQPPQSVAVGYFLRHINANASGECLRELLDFERQLGGDVAVCALKAAQDEQVTKWTYIRSILNAYVAEGVRTVDDVRRREQKRGLRQTGQRSAPHPKADRNAQFAKHDAPLTPMEQRAVERALGKGDCPMTKMGGTDDG